MFFKINPTPFQNLPLRMVKSPSAMRSLNMPWEENERLRMGEVTMTSCIMRQLGSSLGACICMQMHAPKDDPNCLMMHEVMVTSPIRSLSFSSQGMFNERMAEGLLTILNGKFWKGVGLILKNINKK